MPPKLASLLTQLFSQSRSCMFHILRKRKNAIAKNSVLQLSLYSLLLSCTHFRSFQKRCAHVKWNTCPVDKNRVHQEKKKSNTKTCGAFLTIWEFWFALFYNKLLRCSRCLSPKSASEKNPTTSNTKKALYLVRTGHILLLDMKPAEGCCGPLTSLANIVWKSLVWATDPALHQSV